MKINFCRNCKSSKLTRVFSLGNIFYTGKFLKKNLFPRRGPIDVTMCKKCTLVQLEDNFDLKYIYSLLAIICYKLKPKYIFKKNIK